MSSRNLAIKRDGSLVVIRGYKAAGIARSAGLRPTYSGAAGGWMLDASRLPELVAWLEYRNYRYTIEGDEPARREPAPTITTARAEVGLW
jgi:hypothetical protein